MAACLSPENQGSPSPKGRGDFSAKWPINQTPGGGVFTKKLSEMLDIREQTTDIMNCAVQQLRKLLKCTALKHQFFRLLLREIS